MHIRSVSYILKGDTHNLLVNNIAHYLEEKNLRSRSHVGVVGIFQLGPDSESGIIHCLDLELEPESDDYVGVNNRLRSPGFKSKGMVLGLSRQKCMTFNCFHFPVLEQTHPPLCEKVKIRLQCTSWDLFGWLFGLLQMRIPFYMQCYAPRLSVNL